MWQKSGQQAEAVVVQFLRRNAYTIVDQNWRTSRAEIDIIAQKDAVLLFIEVKYRVTQQQGSGLDYITNSKLSQMQRAADWWCLENDYLGEYELAAVSVAGDDFHIEQFIVGL